MFSQRQGEICQDTQKLKGKEAEKRYAKVRKTGKKEDSVWVTVPSLLLPYPGV